MKKKFNRQGWLAVFLIGIPTVKKSDQQTAVTVSGTNAGETECGTEIGVEVVGTGEAEVGEKLANKATAGEGAACETEERVDRTMDETSNFEKTDDTKADGELAEGGRSGSPSADEVQAPTTTTQAEGVTQDDPVDMEDDDSAWIEGTTAKTQMQELEEAKKKVSRPEMRS